MRTLSFIIPFLFLTASLSAQDKKEAVVVDPSSYVSYKQYQEENGEVYADFESMERAMEEDAIYAGKDKYRNPGRRPNQKKERPEWQKEQRRKDIAAQVFVTVAEVGIAIICSGWW